MPVWDEDKWDDSQLLYQQLRRKLMDLILNNTVKSGEMMPSVRTVATEFKLNPVTVMKAYQFLVEDGLVEKQRGIGMFVKPNARSLLKNREQDAFLNNEWPELKKRMQLLGIDWKKLD